MSYFKNTPVNIETNNKLRAPQIESYIKIVEYFTENPSGEALVVLPTGTGKSGLISIAPFGVSNGRVLIITPGIVTKQSIGKTQEALHDNFWVNFDVIFNPEHIPIISEYDPSMLESSLEQCNIVYTNIQKLPKSRDTSLLNRVPRDFFDMIIIDESHHSPADTWQEVIDYFNSAKKLHVTGTPYRGDGQALPGEQIHETPLSEVMRDRYVKWLRKTTVNSSELYFSTPERPGEKLTASEVLEYKDKEWIEKSVALSKECSEDVINQSIESLNSLSNSVPHKILAVGCSIEHAQDLYQWYKQKGVEAVIVHSRMSKEELQESFQKIDDHECRAVISVNMLMEGYDHRYLTVLAVFRPYRSLNAFAQVVGRVLRAIPEEEIEAFEIDNNAIVIYHEETGLDFKWQEFQKEVDRAQHTRIRDYTGLSRDYSERETSLAEISTGEAYVSDQDSFLEDIDFNKLFEEKRAQVERLAEAKLQKVAQSMEGELSSDMFEKFKELLVKEQISKYSDEIDPELDRLRPEKARKALRDLLKKKIEDEATNLLCDLKLAEKTTEVAPKLLRIIPYLKATDPNDACIVRYINTKLHTRMGKRSELDTQGLRKSLDFIPQFVDELRKMLS